MSLIFILSVSAISASDINDNNISSSQSGTPISTNINDLDANTNTDSSQNLNDYVLSDNVKNNDSLSDDTTDTTSNDTNNDASYDKTDTTSNDTNNDASYDKTDTTSDDANNDINENDLKNRKDSLLSENSQNANDDTNTENTNTKINTENNGIASTIDTIISGSNQTILRTNYFSVNLTDINGNSLSNQSVIFNLLNKNYTRTSDENGSAKIKINLLPNSYDVTVYYLGDSTYSPSSANYTISSYQIPVSLKINSARILRGNYFTIYLLDNESKALSNQTVIFNIGNKNYTRTSDKNGSAKIRINLNAGTYKIKVIYAGGEYKGIAKTINLSSYKLATSITPASTSVLKGNKFTITLKDQSGNALSGQNIIFNILGKNYTRTTNSNGNASLTINLKVKNYYNLKVLYKATTSYKASSKTVKLVVTSSTINGQLLVSGKTSTVSGKTYTYSSSNKNTVLVQNGGSLNLKNSTIIKKGDVSSSIAESSDFYGTNAAVLVTAKSKINITDSKIITNATGANAIFASNLASSASGATAYVTNVVINTYKDKSRGLDATYGGKIIAKNVSIYTRGGSCAALATDRGEGIVTVSNSKLYTGVGQKSGSGSPLIYSTGNITVSRTSGISYVSQIACIEGKNSITLTNCNLTGYGKGNRYVNGAYVDLAGVFLYQSMSGDADVGVAKFTASNTNLTIPSASSYYKSAPMFHVTNTAATISLKNCTLSYGSGVLLNASGQSQWGTVGKNGGSVTFTASNMNLNGKIAIDKISSLKLTLTKTKYKGAINPSSSYGTTKVVINSGSTWTLTGNSHISSLSNSGTINYGSYTLYVNGVAYTASNPYKG